MKTKNYIYKNHPEHPDAFVYLPNKIDLLKLSQLLKYSDKYEISIQFWPEQIAVFIAKDGVDLIDYGGSFDFAITRAIEYLNRITRSKPLKEDKT